MENRYDTDLGNGEEAARQEKVIPRDIPDPKESRAALVEFWNERVRDAKTYYAEAFETMRADQRFVRGAQWKDPTDKYVANIAHRHVQQKTAFLYAKNPKVVAKTRPRLSGKVWDATT